MGGVKHEWLKAEECRWSVSDDRFVRQGCANQASVTSKPGAMLTSTAQRTEPKRAACSRALQKPLNY
jgi:hypothetical protein